MALNVHVWATHILSKTFPNDSFLMDSVDESIWVEANTVHSPEDGDEPDVDVDGQSFPMQVKHRDDIDNTYTLRNYRTRPIFLDDVDATEVSYNKRDSILRQHLNVINRNIANWMLYDWAPTTSTTILRTTGANRTAIASNNGATGNRKKIQLDLILKAMVLMDDMDVPQEGRSLLLPAQMYFDLMNDNKDYFTSLEKSGEAILQKGELLNLYGFKVYRRSVKNLLTFDNATTPAPRTPTSTTSTAANAAALCWHKDWVKRAKGGVKVYENVDDATYQGSIMSARVRAGGRKAANDGTGVVAIVETP